MKHLIFGIIISTLLPICISSCNNGGESDGGNSTLDQTEFLKNIGDELIVKGYLDLKAKAESLNSSAATFSVDPNVTNLSQLRQSWLAASKSWQNVALYNFGPAETNAIITINYYPTDTTQIKNNIAGGQGSYDLNAAASTFAKGFPALDYLLFGYADTDQEIVNKFTDNENARIYLTDLTANIQLLVQNVSGSWSSYIDTFKSNKGTSVGSSLTQLVNAWSQYMEVHVRNGKIGIPNGNSVVSSERIGPFPGKTEAYYSKNSLEILKAANKSLRDFYLGKSADGTDGVGIHDLLTELNAQNGTLANDYLALFDDVDTKLNGISTSLEEAIELQGEDVTEVFNDYKAIVALLKVDIVSALSISITYTDNDGD